MTLHMNGDLKYECNEAIEKIIDKAYKRGYEDGENSYGTEIRTKQDVDKAYQQGLEDAWECAKKIACIRTDAEWKKFFEFLDVKLFHPEDIFTKYTAQEAMQKIKDYERKQKWSEQAKRGKERRDEIKKVLEKKHKCETCDLFLKDCIGAVMLNGCDFYKDKESK